MYVNACWRCSEKLPAEELIGTLADVKADPRDDAAKRMVASLAATR